MDTSAFSVQLYATDGPSEYIIAQDLNSLKVSKDLLKGGLVNTFTINPVITTVQDQTNFLIGFTPTNSLSTNSKIVITFPSTDAFLRL